MRKKKLFSVMLMVGVVNLSFLDIAQAMEDGTHDGKRTAHARAAAAPGAARRAHRQSTQVNEEKSRAELERLLDEITVRRERAQNRLDKAYNDKHKTAQEIEALRAHVAALVCEEDLVDGLLHGYYTDVEQADWKKNLAALQAEAVRAAAAANSVPTSAAAAAAASSQQSLRGESQSALESGDDDRKDKPKLTNEE